MVAGDYQNNIVVSDSLRRYDLELGECLFKVNGELQICVNFAPSKSAACISRTGAPGELCQPALPLNAVLASPEGRCTVMICLPGAFETILTGNGGPEANRTVPVSTRQEIFSIAARTAE